MSDWICKAVLFSVSSAAEREFLWSGNCFEASRVNLYFIFEFQVQINFLSTHNFLLYALNSECGTWNNGTKSLHKWWRGKRNVQSSRSLYWVCLSIEQMLGEVMQLQQLPDRGQHFPKPDVLKGKQTYKS